MADREAAPGGLGLVQAFVNTVEIDEDRDDLATPALMRGWLVEMGLAGPDLAVSDEQLQGALALRDAVRGLLLANNGGRPYPVDLATLNQGAQSSVLRVRFLADGSGRLEPSAGGFEATLGWILAAIFTAMAEGNWGRLKACGEHSCRWAFYDRSKNRSSTWCNMAVCGSRTKARTYRQRRRAVAGAQPASVDPSSTPPTQ
jgi:predicted RNA-binding Zn ribbon-like protein